MFEELGDTSWVDQEHMKQITTKNEAIVGQCQHLTDTSQDQEKQINNVIQQIETLTKLLALNGTRSQPQEEDKKEKVPADKRYKMCG